MKACILHQQATPTGYEILVRTPRRHTEPARRLGLTNGRYEVSYQWQAKVRFQVTLQGQTLVFPAPPLRDTTRYDPGNNRHTEADFDDDGQLYWINGFQNPGVS